MLLFASSLLLGQLLELSPEFFQAVSVVGREGHAVQIRIQASSALLERSALLLEDGREVCRLAFVARSGDIATYASEGSAVGRASTQPGAPAKRAAWLLPDRLAPIILSNWPPDADLFAVITDTGPGQQFIWLSAGPNCRAGDSFWVRENGQPIARLDAQFVNTRAAYCTVTPLVAGLRLSAGQRAALWPSPSDVRTERARSAIGFVEPRGDEQMVWVAAPRGIACPAEPKFDIRRENQYIGYAVVERKDDRFWYARTVPAAGTEAVRVGDDVFIRTDRDIRERRFAARIFESTSDGYLINAGEFDQMVVGQEAEVVREGVPPLTVLVTKVQREYSEIRLKPGGDSGWTPGLRDEVRFGRSKSELIPVGRIDAAWRDGAFRAAANEGNTCPTRRPILIRSGAETIGVCVAVSAEHDRIVGVVIDESLSRAIVPGMQLFAVAGEDSR